MENAEIKTTQTSLGGGVELDILMPSDVLRFYLSSKGMYGLLEWGLVPMIHCRD